VERMLLTVKEAAKQLGIRENDLRILVARRRIRHLRRSRRGRIFFQAEWLDEFTAEYEIEPVKADGTRRHPRIRRLRPAKSDAPDHWTRKTP